MANSDLGHKLTDKELAKLERRIATLYREAGKELQATIDAYFEQFKKRDEEMKALIGTVQNGKEWTEADYKQWRLNQIGRGERYQAMRDKVAQRATDANAVAVSYTNDATPGIYSLNRNYAAYTIERVTGNIGFDLWDEQTVKRLMVEQPDLMPYYPKDRALKRGIDLAYGKKQITASVTSSILQGKSIKHMADDLQKRITTMSRDSAIRTARTAVTGAQNAGRMDSYAAAEKMGIKLKKEWLATLDARTRHSHAMLDGEQVAQDKKFSNGCRFPGDPQGPPWEIYNCRCTLIAAVDGVDTSDGLRRTRDGLISDVTYAQWEASKQGYSGKQLSPYHMGIEKSAKDVTKKYIDSAKPRMGKVRYENGYRSKKHKEEINVANQIRELFGGKIVLLKESQTPGMKMPDMLWKGKQWEIKSISTEKAADSALRKAIKQIHGNQGGVIFDVADGIDKQKLIDVLDARATRSKSFNADIIALHNGSVLFVRRYKK
jgi:SPP1 gp7 family putative phage head morphogenesis protein|nr:MAG TPA: minor capsid protein [Caudoviricetes sp.]